MCMYVYMIMDSRRVTLAIIQTSLSRLNSGRKSFVLSILLSGQVRVQLHRD